jgi:polysaccharide pyruvyl transferase WcaK-like protein/glycosyltransferase involved in cell wall biosynthesis
MESKIKICFILSHLPQGGAERQTINLVKGLNSSKYDVTFLLYNSLDEVFYDEIKGLSINLIVRKSKKRNRVLRSIDNAAFIRKFLKESDFDIIHTLLFHNGFWVRLVAPVKYNNRIIFSVRSSLEEASKVFLYFEKFFIKKSFVISNSVKSKKQYLQLVGDEYNEKISNIYNGIDFDKFGMSNIPVLSDKIVVGTVGRQTDVKNQIQILKVINKIKDSIPVHFYLIGEKAANRAQENENYILNHSLESIVSNYNSLPNIEEYYPKFNIFILSSRHEGCPNALLEAMLAKCLCIISDGANSDQFITDGVNGFVYDGTTVMLESKLRYAVELLQNKTAEEIINNGYKYVVDNFSIKKMVSSYELMYKNMIQNRKLKILVCEAYTDSNVGSCALVENSIYLLKNKYPNAEIRLMSYYPQVYVGKYGVDVVNDIFDYPYVKNHLQKLLWLIKTLYWMIFIYFLPERISTQLFNNKTRDFFWADWIVSIGAERINDKYIKNEFFSEYTYKFVKRIKRKMILFPCTIGPFLSKYTENLFKKVGKDIDLIYTRDLQSHLLTNRLLDKTSNSINTCDVAVFQNWESRKEMLNKKYNKQIVGISVLKWSYFANKANTPYSNYKSYVNEMASVIDTLINKYNVHITLIPTNFPIHGGNGDDLKVAFEIFNKSTGKKDIDIIENLVTPTELKSILSASEINITTRMHACILSTGAFVPTISINYLFKLREYMNSIGLEDYSVDICDFEHTVILDMFEKMWNTRDYWQAHLKIEIEQNKQNLLNAINELDALL